MNVKNIEIFEDTQKFIKENETLKKSVSKSICNQRVYKDEIAHGSLNIYENEAEIMVSKKRSFEAARAYAEKGLRTCVLNFADSLMPGGLVKSGSSAQEEALCRCSTLYNCLISHENIDEFYGPHEVLDHWYNDDCIYTPDVTVFKSDTKSPERLPEKDWFKADVITCAAPNLRGISSYTEDEFRAAISKRVDKIFSLAAFNRAEALVLGAFGCGVFSNPPEIVSAVFKEYSYKYRYAFKFIEFAVYCSSYDTKNYSIFAETMK